MTLIVDKISIELVMTCAVMMAMRLIDMLKSTDRVARREAEAALEAMGSEAIESLAVAMRSDDPGQAWRAARLLAKIEDPRRTFYMEQALASTNGLVGQVAVKAIVDTLSPSQAGDILTKNLLTSAPIVQIHMVAALSLLGHREAIGNLVVLLETSVAAEVRYSTIEALGLLHATQAADVIRSFADDGNHHVRERVQTALQLLVT